MSTEHTYGVACPFTCSDDFQVDDEETAVQLYRIGQEAINNAVKHANASRIDISLNQVNGRAELIVRDDGCGFTNRISGREGHGLRIMDYRAKVIGAAFKIESELDGGTRISCKFRNERLSTAN